MPTRSHATSMLLSLLLAACSELKSAGQQCVFNDDCIAPLVCAGHACRAQCRSDRDCPQGFTCNPSEQPSKRVCLPPTAPSLCSSHLDCPVGTLCLANASCWRRCTSDAVCAAVARGAVCVPGAQVCSVATSAEEQHREPPNRDGPVPNAGDASPPGDLGALDADAAPLDAPTVDAPEVTPPDVASGDAPDAAPQDLAPPDAPLDASFDAPQEAMPDVAAADFVESDRASMEGGLDVVPDVAPDVEEDLPRIEIPCASGVADCNGDPRDLCEANLALDARHCGRCGNACPAPANATARCELGVCGFRCSTGYHLSIDGLVCAPDTPRMLAPMSTATTNRATPLLRWVLAAGQDGARLEVCRTRVCDAASVVYTADVTGAEHRPAALARGQYFWRLRGLRGGAPVTPFTEPWQLRVAPAPVGALEAVSATDVDPNGDGRADLLVGASAPNNSAARGDRAQLYLSTPSGFGPTPSVRFDGTANDGLGGCVGSAGDVNGDGYGDVFVTRTVGAGALLVFHGGPLGVSSAPATMVTGPGSFGDDVAAAGDVDGDGYGDLVAVTSGATPTPVFVYPGGSRGLSTAATTLAGPPPRAQAIAVAGAADINGDGRSDFVVGFAGGVGVGVYLSQASGPAPSPSQVLTASPAPGFGMAVALADVNGDGYADVLAGAEGALRVYNGSAGGVPTTPSQTLANGAHGGALSRLGDLNGDGYEDVLVGNAGAAASAQVHYGSAAGLTVGVTLTAPAGFSIRYGSVVAGAGDLDGDGRDDLVVGDYDHRAVHIFYGTMSGLRAGEVLREASVPAFGSTVATLPAARFHLAARRPSRWFPTPLTDS